VRGDLKDLKMLLKRAYLGLRLARLTISAQPTCTSNNRRKKALNLGAQAAAASDSVV
jgi:hypothetical protein